MGIDMNIKMKFAAGLLAGVAMAGAAQASFVVLNRLDSQQVLDSSSNLVWASDWNLAQTSGYSADGLMTWAQSSAWIASLNSSNYAGHSDWRLPTANTAASSNCSSNFNPGGGFSQQYAGYGCTGSEMGHLFYEALGGRSGESILNQTDDSAGEKANLALFKNVQSSYYWSGTEYAPNTNLAWGFSTGGGTQGYDDKNFSLYALAVRPGDVTAAVPEPQTLALALIALTGALVARRRRRAA